MSICRFGRRTFGAHTVAGVANRRFGGCLHRWQATLPLWPAIRIRSIRNRAPKTSCGRNREDLWNGLLSASSGSATKSTEHSGSECSEASALIAVRKSLVLERQNAPAP